MNRILPFCVFLLAVLNSYAQNSNDQPNLIMSLLGDTPIEEDLQELCDVYGGRVTGTTTNLESVEWGLEKFKEAGVAALKSQVLLIVPLKWWLNITLSPPLKTV